MQRDLAAMAAKEHDLLIIGGGIAGICIARDAVLRGLSVALVEKSDFAGATTAASSKLIHGGLRYLQSLELGLVRESLRERRVWSHIAPHMVHPLTFLMPLYGKGIRKRLTLTLGLTAYDLLAYDRNRLDDPEKYIPSHRSLNRAEALALEPGIESPTLSGGIIFYDYQMHFPERLALACLRNAVEMGAQAANYLEAREFVQEDGVVVGARVRDNLSHQPECVLRARLTVNATGPWSDILMDTLLGSREHKRLIRSKGIHILTKSITRGHAVAALTDKGHFFILPWHGYSLIGTTDTVYRGDPDAFRVTEKDISDFIDSINEAYPGAHLRREDVLYFYGGLRPIVDQTSNVPGEETEEKDSYRASRAAEIVDHEIENGLPGIITAIGGKWTTARALAEQVVDLAAVKLGAEAVPCRSGETPVYGGDTGIFAEFLAQAREKFPAFPPDVVEHLAYNYGAGMGEVLRVAEERPDLSERICEGLPNIAAEIPHAVRHEMAFSMEDILFRRTGIGAYGVPDLSVLDRIGALAGEELEWSPAEIKAQRDRVQTRYQPSSRARAVVNPRSSGGKTRERWPALSGRLARGIGPFDTVYTDGPMAAKRLTMTALKDGVEHIIAVGGDGTVNEVVNGFFEKERPINPHASLSIITSGTGADFRRTFGTPDDLDRQLYRVVDGETHAIDVGLLTYRDDSTAGMRKRYFDNVASFGMSGMADKVVNQLTFAKKFGGKFAFQWGTLKALLSYKGQRVRLRVDDTFDEILDINTVAVCNGCYFGGGMKIAPEAKPDDGLLDIIVVRHASVFQILKGLPGLYAGRHLENTKYVFMLRGRKITAEPVHASDEILLDVDGEAPGRLPATFEIVPRALLLKY